MAKILKIRLSLLLLALNLVIINLLFAEDRLIFICEEYPPYEYINKNMPAGMDVEVIDAVCKKAGIAYEIKFYPWERCVAMMKDGRADVIFGLLKNPERTKYLKYPDSEVSYDKRVLISLKTYPGLIKDISDLKGKTVGVGRGYSYGEPFDSDPYFIKEMSASSVNMIDKLNNKRYDLIAINEYVAKYLILEKHWKNYKIHPYIIYNGPLYTAFSYNSKRAMKYFNIYNNTLSAMNKSGELNHIRNNYR